MTPDAAAPHAAHPKVLGAKGKRIKTIAASAVNLQGRLLSDPLGAAEDNQLLDELRGHIRSLHSHSQRSKPGSAGDSELDRAGTVLWNLCTRLRRESDAQPRSTNKRKLFLLGRVFAFHLLGAAQCTENADAAAVVRLLRLALKAGRSCIDDSEFGFATLVLQKAVDCNTRLHDLRSDLSADDVKDARGLEAEYFILRAALAWKENRLDVAEHMYNNGKLTPEFLDPYQVEKLADVLYEIGKDLSGKSDFSMAAKWLNRAHDVVNSQGLELLSREAIELRTAILQTLVTALLGLGTTGGFETADNLVNVIESEMGNELVVSLLRLEILQKSPAEVFDSDSYADVLRRMIKSFNFTESTFKLVVHHIRKLHDKTPGLGCKVIDEFIRALRNADTDEWIERLVIIRMWMTTNQRDSVDTIQSAEDVLTQVDRHLSADAAIAAQTLIWKRLESGYSLGQFELAEKWCHLALHAAFRNCGPGNIAKLERKVLLCAIARNEMDGARSIFHSMAESTQREPKTMYLMYKVATRTGDRSLATRCLESVSMATEQQDYLYACVVDSQQAGDKVCAVEALRKLLEKHEYKSPSPVHLPALLRCTIRLLKSVLDSDDGRCGEMDGVQYLCELFDAAVTAIEREPRDANGNKLFSIDELDWFARNAYNLGLKHLDSWDLRHSIHILTACTSIIKLFPSDVTSQVAQDMSFKLIFSNFIIASALVAQARTQDNVEKQLQDYLLMRKHIAAFEAELPGRLDSLEGKAREDLLSKLATLLTFDLEGAICLKKWEDLGEIIRKTVQCKSVTAFQGMGDCLLRSSVPGRELYATMRIIINEIWTLENFTVEKLAKYMRCLFQATLPLDDGLALGLMDEFCEWTCEASKTMNQMPAEELEWLATTAFNHAVDCYAARQDEQSKQWASKALNLAHYCNDGGALEGILHEKHLSLRFDAK